ncbi:MAG: membrane dipeptidase [Planctomycetota bacterium]|nr:MAG: membrane dipeptidase [Planctomycetota bacterium]
MIATLLFLFLSWAGSDGMAQEPAGGKAPAVSKRPPVVLSEQALRLHHQALLVDGHNDLPWQIRSRAGGRVEALDIRRPRPRLHTDMERLRAGGIGAQFWSAFAPVSHPQPVVAFQEQIDLIRRMCAFYPEFELALTAADIRRIRREGKIAGLIGVEGGHAIGNSLGVLRNLYALGARYMTLTHSANLDWADSATDEPKLGGLSPFGEDVVRTMNRLGMLVDISHVSAETMADVLKVAQAPVIASHSSAFALAPHPRNVPDSILAQLPQNGGVIMVNFYTGYLVGEVVQALEEVKKVRRELRQRYPEEEEFRAQFAAWRAANPVESGTVHHVVDHIDHIAKVAGIDHVGLGSDFDGISQLPRQLQDVSMFPYITQEMLNRGYSETDIGKVLGLNLLRALEQAEQVASSLTEAAK